MFFSNRIFFTGAPGSRWSGIAQEIEHKHNLNTSDRTPERSYSHDNFSGHQGVYFGTGMEFPASLDESVLDAPYKQSGCKLHKSHEWAYKLTQIKERYPECGIILIYRNSFSCYNWWKQAGGWNITYPNYSWYEDDTVMQQRISEQNDLILEFAQQHKLTWTQHHKHADVFITTYKGYNES